MESHTNQTAKRSIHHDALIAAQQKVVLAAQNALDAQKEILQIYMKNATADTRKVKRSKVDDGRPKKLSGYLLFCKEKRLDPVCKAMQEKGDNRGIMAFLGNEWTKLSDTVKESFNERAKENFDESLREFTRESSVNHEAAPAPTPVQTPAPTQPAAPTPAPTQTTPAQTQPVAQTPAPTQAVVPTKVVAPISPIPTPVVTNTVSAEKSTAQTDVVSTAAPIVASNIPSVTPTVVPSVPTVPKETKEEREERRRLKREKKAKKLALAQSMGNVEVLK